MTKPAMTVREINRITRDGGTGRNVYFNGHHVTHARTVRGDMLVRVLSTGAWFIVGPHDMWEIK